MTSHTLNSGMWRCRLRSEGALELLSIGERADNRSRGVAGSVHPAFSRRGVLAKVFERAARAGLDESIRDEIAAFKARQGIP